MGGSIWSPPGRSRVKILQILQFYIKFFNFTLKKGVKGVKCTSKSIKRMKITAINKEAPESLCPLSWILMIEWSCSQVVVLWWYHHFQIA